MLGGDCVVGRVVRMRSVVAREELMMLWGWGGGRGVALVWVQPRPSLQ